MMLADPQDTGRQYLYIYKDSADETQKFRNISKKITDQQQMIIAGGSGCQPKNSKVLMADGEWKNVEDIKIGDCVLSPQEDGSIVYSEVVKTMNWDCNGIYAIRQTNKEHKELYQCSFNHLIPLSRRTTEKKHRTKGDNAYEWAIAHYSAKQLSKLSNKRLSSCLIGFSSPAITKFKNRINCEIEPYTLGVWLGDGHFNKYSYCSSHLAITTMDDEIIKEISKYYPYMSVERKKNNKASTYKFSTSSELFSQLKKYNLEGKKSGDKFIPKEALLSDIEYRKRLLAGMIDTDGYLAHSAGCSICTKSKQMAQDILDLIYSLGGRGNIKPIKKGFKRPDGTRFVGDYYNISCYLGKLHLPLQLKRKQKTCGTIYLDSNRISIKAVRQEKGCRVYGFTLDSPSQWYVTNNWMVTHNSGKSVFAETITDSLHESGCKIVYITCKPISEFDNAYAMFKPTAEYHLQKLKQAKIEPKAKKVDIYHPFTFAIPKTQLPEIKFYGFSLNTLSEEAFATLLGLDEDRETTRTCYSVAKRLKENENMWDYLMQIYEEIGDKEKLTYKPEDLLPTKLTGDTRTLSRIVDAFKSFRENMFLLPENHELVLDYESILNDQETYSVFITKWGLSKREKYMTIIQLVKEFEEAMKKGNVKHPLVIVFEEIRVLLAKSNKNTYEEHLARILRDSLSVLRTAGRGVTTIGTTQSYFATDSEYCKSVTVRLFGKLCLEDLKTLSRELNIKSNDFETLAELQNGQFVWFEEMLRGYPTKMYAFMPPHAHAEEGSEFIEEYRKNFPDKMQKYTDLLVRMRQDRKQIEATVRDKVAELRKKLEKKDTAEPKAGKPDDSAIKSMEQMVKDEKDKNLMEQCYRLKKNDNKLSWVKISKQLDISPPTAKKKAMEFAKSAQDQEFIKNNI